MRWPAGLSPAAGSCGSVVGGQGGTGRREREGSSCTCKCTESGLPCRLQPAAAAAQRVGGEERVRGGGEARGARCCAFAALRPPPPLPASRSSPHPCTRALVSGPPARPPTHSPRAARPSPARAILLAPSCARPPPPRASQRTPTHPRRLPTPRPAHHPPPAAASPPLARTMSYRDRSRSPARGGYGGGGASYGGGGYGCARGSTGGASEGGAREQRVSRSHPSSSRSPPPHPLAAPLRTVAVAMAP